MPSGVFRRWLQLGNVLIMLVFNSVALQRVNGASFSCYRDAMSWVHVAFVSLLYMSTRHLGLHLQLLLEILYHMLISYFKVKRGSLRAAVVFIVLAKCKAHGGQ